MPPPPPLETTMPPLRTADPCFVTRRLAKKNPVGSTNMTALVSEGPFTGPDASSFIIGAISRHLAAASSLLRRAWAAHRSMKVIRPLRTLSRCRCSHRAACSSPLRCARAAQRSRGVMRPLRAFSRCRSCHRAARSSLLRCTSAVHSSRKPNPPGPPSPLRAPPAAGHPAQRIWQNAPNYYPRSLSPRRSQRPTLRAGTRPVSWPSLNAPAGKRRTHCAASGALGRTRDFADQQVCTKDYKHLAK